MSTITIPPQLVPHVRSAVTHDLGEAGGDILGQSERKNPKLTEPLERFDRLRAVLDALPADPDTPARVQQALVPPTAEALRDHARTLTEMQASALQQHDVAGVDKMQAELDELEAGVTELLATVKAGSDDEVTEVLQTHGYGSSCLANFMTGAPPKIVKQIRGAMDRRPDFNPDNEDELRELLAVGLSLGDLDRRESGTMAGGA